jgi:hypothetical protein
VKVKMIPSLMGVLSSLLMEEEHMDEDYDYSEHDTRRCKTCGHPAFEHDDDGCQKMVVGRDGVDVCPCEKLVLDD